jgi:hypothetical protein
MIRISAPTIIPATTTDSMCGSPRPDIAADAMAFEAHHVSLHVIILPKGRLDITFIGWTGKGMPKKTPVRTLKKPENTRVESRFIDPWTAKAIMSGNNVPKSPKAPETSASGDLLRVSTLWTLTRRSSAVVSISTV